MTFRIGIRHHIKRQVLAVGLDRLHIRRHDKRQKCRRFCTTGQDGVSSFAVDIKVNQQRIQIRLKLSRYRHIGDRQHCDDRFITHYPAHLDNIIQVFFIIADSGFPFIAAVGIFGFAVIALSDALFSGRNGGIGTVLQADRQVSLFAQPVVVIISKALRAFHQYQRNICLFRRVNQRQERCNLLRNSRFNHLIIFQIAEEIDFSLFQTVRDIDFGARVERQDIIFIFQQNDRLQLTFKAKVDIFLFADYLPALVRDQIGVFKQSGSEQRQQNPVSSLLKPFFHDLFAVLFDAEVIRCHYRLDLIVAAELVDTVHNRLEDTCRTLHCLDTVGSMCKCRNLFTRFMLGYAPVGADNTIKMVFLAEQVMDNIMRISIADIFIRVNSSRDGIIRHNCTTHPGRAVQFERTFGKDAHMHIKVISGINRIFAVSIMRIPSAFTCAAARPVFCHRVN